MNRLKVHDPEKPYIEQDVRAAISLVYNTFKVLKKHPTLEEISKFCSIHNFPIPTKKDFELAIQQKYITLKQNAYVLDKTTYPIIYGEHIPPKDYTIKKDYHHILEVNKATRNYLNINSKKEVPVPVDS